MKIYNREKAVSKAQVEVWEAKEKLYKEVKNLDIKDAIRQILGKTKLRQINKNKPAIKNTKKRSGNTESVT